jgi:hypothetical protein
VHLQANRLREALSSAGVAVREAAAWHLEDVKPGWEMAHSKTWFDGVWRWVMPGTTVIIGYINIRYT